MLFYRLCLGIGTIIGACTCLGGRFCNLPEWDTDVFDSLTNVVLIHDIIAGIWVLVCVLWKILIPLGKYLDMTVESYGQPGQPDVASTYQRAPY